MTNEKKTRSGSGGRRLWCDPDVTASCVNDVLDLVRDVFHNNPGWFDEHDRIELLLEPFPGMNRFVVEITGRRWMYKDESQSE